VIGIHHRDLKHTAQWRGMKEQGQGKERRGRVKSVEIAKIVKRQQRVTAFHLVPNRPLSFFFPLTGAFMAVYGALKEARTFSLFHQ